MRIDQAPHVLAFSTVAFATSAPVALTSEHIDVEDHISSSSVTPVPAAVARLAVDATEAPTVLDDGAAAIRAASRLVNALAILPTSEEDEAIVDRLVAERTSGRKMEPLG